MAESKESGSESGTRTPEKRAEEVGVVARTMVTEKAAAQAKTLKSTDSMTDAEGALHVVNMIQTFKDKDDMLRFSDDSLKMKGFQEEGFDFKDNETSIAEISGVTDDGYLICTLRDNNTGEIVQSQDRSGPQLFGRLREDVIDAQIFSEKSNLLPEFDGDDKKLLRTYVDSRPQSSGAVTLGAEVDDEIDKGAERHGIMTAADVQKFVDGLDDDQRNSTELQNALKVLKQGKLVTPAEFSAIIAIAGFDKESMDAKVESLQEDIDKLETEKGEIADDDKDKAQKEQDFDDKIAEAQKKKGAFDKAKKVLDDKAEAEDAEIAAKLQAEAEAQERRATPEADEAIASQITYLQQELNTKDPKDLSVTDKAERETRIAFLKGQLSTMQLASMAKGDAGAFIKQGALNTAIARVGEESAEGQRLKAIRDGIEDKAKDGKDALIDVVENSGEDQDKIDKLKAAIDSSQGDLAKMLMSGDLASLEGFAETVFGNEKLSVDDAREIDKLKEAAILNLADSKGLTPEQKAKALKALKIGSWAALIAALAVTVLPMAAMTALASKGLGQQAG